MPDFTPLEDLLNYHFTNKELLTTALTHPSLSYESKGTIESNQRLEFLGDAVLQIILSRHLYDTFPQFAEGKLTQLRSQLVSGKAFHSIAKHHQLGNFFLMSPAEEASGGRTKPSALADLFEALIGAIYLDGGLKEVRTVIFHLMDPLLQGILHSSKWANPKGSLQELLQNKEPIAPVYHITKEEGPPHQRQFTAIVQWKERTLGQGKGSSKQEAEAQAANNALSKIESSQT